MPSSDYKVEIVDASGEADMSVSIVGDQVVDLDGATTGQVLVVQADGTVEPASESAPVTVSDPRANILPIRVLGVLNHTGAPVAADGTFSVGDVVFDSGGQEWLNTVAGSPGTWVAVGSGRVLASVALAAQFTMATDATVEDVTGASLTFTYDGRPVRFVLTPVYSGTDDVGYKVITTTICRSSDNAIQVSHLRGATSSLDTDTVQMDSGPLTAWPSDSVAFVVGTPYTIKLRLLTGALAKAILYGQFTPYQFYVITA